MKYASEGWSRLGIAASLKLLHELVGALVIEAKGLEDLNELLLVKLICLAEEGFLHGFPSPEAAVETRSLLIRVVRKLLNSFVGLASRDLSKVLTEVLVDVLNVLLLLLRWRQSHCLDVIADKLGVLGLHNLGASNTGQVD